MGLQIEPEKAMRKIDDFLEQIDDLLDKRYDEGKEEKRAMSTKLDNFTKVAFENGDEKANKLHKSIAVLGGRKSEREKQEEYEDSLKRKKRHLEAWKEQIELEEDFDSSSEEESEEDEMSSESKEGRDFAAIENEIQKLEDDLPVYSEELKISVEELRDGHLLASVMITGRVIDYTLDQIKSSQGLGGPEEVLEHLEDNNIADSGGVKVTDSIKSYRDKYTHEVGKMPPTTDAMIILLGCAKLLHNIVDEGKESEYDLA